MRALDVVQPDSAAFFAQGNVGLAIGGAVAFLFCVVLGMQFVRSLW